MVTQINTQIDMKGGENMGIETEQRTKTYTIYKDKCIVCGRVIEGFSEKQVRYNLEIHLMTHRENANN